MAGSTYRELSGTVDPFEISKDGDYDQCEEEVLEIEEHYARDEKVEPVETGYQQRQVGRTEEHTADLAWRQEERRKVAEDHE